MLKNCYPHRVRDTFIQLFIAYIANMWTTVFCGAVRGTKNRLNGTDMKQVRLKNDRVQNMFKKVDIFFDQRGKSCYN